MLSAGLLVYRWRDGEPQFLLAHAGGPYWAGKDEAAWGMPKGLAEPGEAPRDAAAREFLEEVGQPPPPGGLALTTRSIGGGKQLAAWLVEGDLDVSAGPSTDLGNRFEIEWPPKSGRRQSYPEIDQLGWFTPQEALKKAHRGQRPILEEAIGRLQTS
jgi:predicted NUDIX family NTP pyrophosphohydrolase